MRVSDVSAVAADNEPAADVPTDVLTVLRCDPGRRATKVASEAPDGSVHLDGYDAGRFYAVRQVPVDGPRTLAAALDDVSRDPRSFLIRAEPREGVDLRRCRRLLHDKTEDDGTVTAAAFREVPRRYVVVDFDKVPGPYRFNPCDGEMAAAYCKTLLPAPFRRASCWWGLSSSAGFKPGVKIKLAFWLDRPMTGAELDRLLEGAPHDPSVLRPVQPIYVARPILRGVQSPVRQRTGLDEDLHDVVPVPALPAVAPREAPATHSPAGRRYVSGATASVAERRLEALALAVERAGQGGRHRCLLWAAARAVELDDALSRAAIADRLKAAARAAGLDDSDRDLTRQIANGFKLGIFGTGAAA